VQIFSGLRNEIKDKDERQRRMTWARWMIELILLLRVRFCFASSSERVSRMSAQRSPGTINRSICKWK
jgi:hypothetical protein